MIMINQKVYVDEHKTKGIVEGVEIDKNGKYDFIVRYNDNQEGVFKAKELTPLYVAIKQGLVHNQHQQNRRYLQWDKYRK